MNSRSRSVIFSVFTLIATALFIWTALHLFETVVLSRSGDAQVRNLALTQLAIEAFELFICSVVIFFSTRQLLGRSTTASDARLSQRLRNQQDVEGAPSRS